MMLFCKTLPYSLYNKPHIVAKSVHSLCTHNARATTLLYIGTEHISVPRATANLLHPHQNFHPLLCRCCAAAVPLLCRCCDGLSFEHTHLDPHGGHASVQAAGAAHTID